MKLITNAQEWKRKEEINDLNEQIRTYKTMAEQNHHVAMNLCDKAHHVLNTASAINADAAQAMHHLSKAVDDARGVPYKDQKGYQA